MSAQGVDVQITRSGY